MSKYDLNSKFDINQHKKHYVNYLEVLISPKGDVEYAVPSHQEKLIAICMDKLKVSRQGLSDLTPEEYYFDFLTWLCKISGYVSVWNDFICYFEITNNQLSTLRQLKAEGLYRGDLPQYPTVYN